MIQFIIFFILFCLIAHDSKGCTAEQKFIERCDQACIDDQEQSWVPAPFVCVCGPPKELKKPNLKLPQSFKGKSIIPVRHDD